MENRKPLHHTNGTSLSQAALGQALGLSRRQVGRLLREGMPSTIEAARRWRDQREKARTEVAATKAEALLRWRRARRQLAELEVGIAMGELVDRTEARNVIGARLIDVKRRVLQIPRLAPQLVGKSRAQIEQRLAEAFEQALAPLREPIVFPMPPRGSA